MIKLTAPIRGCLLILVLVSFTGCIKDFETPKRSEFVKNSILPGAPDGKNNSKVLTVVKDVNFIKVAETIRKIVEKKSYKEAAPHLNNLQFQLVDFLNTTSVFVNLNEDQIKELIQQSTTEYFKTNPIYHRELLPADQCSQAYSVGINACDNAFTTSAAFLVGAYLANAILSLGLSAVSSSFVLTAGIAQAWVEHTNCQNAVVAAWKICRENTPIN